ncbi:Sec-independent protein translocase subunit TatA/TatB [Mucilaginibacter agri]|uniref:Sec-independent protein translocase subunit TatA/TatB n=1 Tax=Mucilaginibacter agri TaxID=2695265 RepID=UPI001FB849DE|nr:twin-arginine translocase TatA/TatE family subunit [Mucilaginibacter agri]
MFFHPVFLFLNIGTPEMILILFVALLLFGGEKLPQLARGLGKGIRDFKDASEGVKRELHNQINNFEEKNTPVVEPEPDKDLPVVANTVALSDPFAPPVVEEHETPVAEHTEVTPEAQHADLSHLANNPEVNHVSENHISLSHVSEEHKADEEHKS